MRGKLLWLLVVLVSLTAIFETSHGHFHGLGEQGDSFKARIAKARLTKATEKYKENLINPKSNQDLEAENAGGKNVATGKLGGGKRGSHSVDKEKVEELGRVMGIAGGVFLLLGSIVVFMNFNEKGEFIMFENDALTKLGEASEKNAEERKHGPRRNNRPQSSEPRDLPDWLWDDDQDTINVSRKKTASLTSNKKTVETTKNVEKVITREVVTPTNNIEVVEMTQMKTAKKNENATIGEMLVDAFNKYSNNELEMPIDPVSAGIYVAAGATILLALRFLRK